MNNILSDPRNAAELSRHLLEASPDAIVIINPHGLIKFINTQTEDLFGYGRAEVLGQTMDLLISQTHSPCPEIQREPYAQDPSLRQLGKTREICARHKDGHALRVEIGYSSLQTVEGQLTIAAIRDVRPHSQTEEVILKHNRELQARVERRTTALRRAHDKLHHAVAERRRLEKEIIKREIIETNEREQRRLDHDLHEDLGQRLVGISYMSHAIANRLAARTSPEADHAAKITELLNNALALSRSLAQSHCACATPPLTVPGDWAKLGYGGG